ncbi:AbiTii domain-containing protein [Rhizobium johnstonii]|uniref:AbiTii domain-containing protein n=1 Tax=Rhizobium johnstonii TaxID=3019933 RepID=UPI003F9D13A7
MGLLTEIQNDAISDAVPVNSILRKVMLLAHRLDSGLLEDWVKHELNGYPNNTEVPDYRKIPLNFKARLTNGVVVHNEAPIAQYLVKKATGQEHIDTFDCRQAIGTIDYKNAGNDTLVLNMDNFALVLPGKAVDKNWDVLGFWAEMPAAKVNGILDAVRNKVLEFTIALQKRYPNADDVEWIKNQASGAATVSQVFNTTINNGNAGVIGHADASTINITVNNGNLQDLRTQLTQHGVSDEDLKELEAALNDEPEINEKKFGPKVAGWVGNMLGKAGAGAWNVGLGAAGSLLEKALLGYYGFPS